jgi:hypothetical protein
VFDSEEIDDPIKFPERFKQKISFQGIRRHRNIRPTDIDGLIDYAGNAFILLESKKYDAPIIKAQREAYERLVLAAAEAGKPSCVIQFRHYEENTDNPVIAKNCIVEEIFWEGKWHAINSKTVLECIDLIEKRFNKMHIYI